MSGNSTWIIPKQKNMYRFMYIIFKITNDKHKFSMVNNALSFFMHRPTLFYLRSIHVLFSKTHAC